MIVVLTGAPGAGKGTQADMLEAKLGYRKISTGDALRKHIKEGTDVGKIAGDLMANGKLVPDDVLFEVLKQELGDRPDEKILLDGYPRNLAQAKTLKSLESIHPVKVAIQMDVPTEKLVERLSGRRVCGQCGKSFHLVYDPPSEASRCDNCMGELVQRPDDAEEKVKVRLEVYNAETKPILKFYQDEDLFRQIDGDRGQNEVFEELKEVIGQVS